MAKTNAEKCREYRLRKKKDKPVKKPMTNAERLRKFREKKKLKKIMEEKQSLEQTTIKNQELEITVDQQFDKAMNPSPSNNLFASMLMPEKVKIPKTSTERCREYRERKRREKNGENTKQEKSKQLGNQKHKRNSTNSRENDKREYQVQSYNREHINKETIVQNIQHRMPYSVNVENSFEYEGSTDCNETHNQRNYSIIGTPMVAPKNPGPVFIIRTLKKQEAGKSLLKLEIISTQTSSERLHNDQITETEFIKQENINIKTETDPDDNKCEVSFGDKHQMESDTRNIDENNEKVNIKVENEYYDDHFETLKEEYPYELPVTKMEIQIKEEPFEKNEVF